MLGPPFFTALLSPHRVSYPLASPAMGHWGMCPPRLTTIIFFQCTLTGTKSDRDYMLTVTSCMCPSWHQILATPLLVSSVRRTHASARHRAGLERLARQLLRCCPVVMVSVERPTHNFNGDKSRGRYSRRCVSVPVSFHHPSGRGYCQQTADCTQAEVVRCNHIDSHLQFDSGVSVGVQGDVSCQISGLWTVMQKSHPTF